MDDISELYGGLFKRKLFSRSIIDLRSVFGLVIKVIDVEAFASGFGWMDE